MGSLREATLPENSPSPVNYICVTDTQGRGPQIPKLPTPSVRKCQLKDSYLQIELNEHSLEVVLTLSKMSQGRRRLCLFKSSCTNVWGTTLALESETSPMQTLWRGLLPESGGVTAAPESSLSSRAALTEINWALSTKQAP